MRVLVLACVLLVAACSGERPEHAAPAVLVEVRQTGGLCQDGRCDDRLTVFSDGAWRRTQNGRRAREGRLAAGELDELRRAMSVTTLPSAPARAGTGCPADADGREAAYIVDTVTVTSCRNALPADDPLLEFLDRLLARSQ